jgi:hypothetical protein
MLEQNGQPKLPPIPEDAPPAMVVQPVAEPVRESAKPAAAINPMAKVFTALSKFVVVCKISSVPAEDFDMLMKKGLVVSYGEFAVCSQKGLSYLVDFEIVA